jgi:uncharacterized protein YecT (DUF1311 family)
VADGRQLRSIGRFVLVPVVAAVAAFSAAARPAAAQRDTAAVCADETTAGMRRCLTLRLEGAEAELAGVLREARREAQSAALLDAAQGAWRRYVARDCRAAADVYRGGSLAPAVALGCRLDHTRARIRFVREDYQVSDMASPGRRDLAVSGVEGALPEGDELSRELMAVEDRRFAAMVRADTAALAALLDGELEYVHTTGRVDTAEELLRSLASRALRYERIEPEGRQVRIYGDVALITGRAAMRAGMAEARDFQIRYLAAYARRRGGWVLLAWQSTLEP